MSAECSRWRRSTSPPRVLKNMRKPAKEVFDRFSAEYSRMNKKLGKETVHDTVLHFLAPRQYAAGCVARAGALHERDGIRAGSGAGFLPDTGDSGDMHVLGGARIPFTMKKVYVAKTEEEKKTAAGADAFQ